MSRSRPSGSETRVKQVAYVTRWSPTQYTDLQRLADYTGCTKAEALRRLVQRADKQILASRVLVVEVGRIGNNINQLTKARNAGAVILPQQFHEAYRDLVAVTRALRQ